MKSKVLTFLILAFILTGCLQQDIPCSTNTDCPPDMFCVDGKCSDLACKEKGKPCTDMWECCGTLACVNNICESIDELDHVVKISMGEGDEAVVYRSLIKLKNFDLSLDDQCNPSKQSALVMFEYNGENMEKNLGIGDEIRIGNSHVYLENILGNPASGKCTVRSKNAVLGMSRSFLFNDTVRVGSTRDVSGTNISITLLNITETPATDPQSGLPPCRYQRTAQVVVSSDQDEVTVNVSNTEPIQIGDYTLNLDAYGLDEFCLSSQPFITFSFVEKEEIFFIEGKSEIFENILIELDKIDLTLESDPCTIKDSRLLFSFKDLDSTYSKSINMREGESAVFEGIEFILMGVDAEFKESAGCGLNNPSALLRVGSEIGKGGIFQKKVPANTLVFIENEEIREEIFLSKECSAGIKNIREYEFDVNARVLKPVNKEITEGAIFAYGSVVTKTGLFSSGKTKSLLVGKEIPFEENTLKLSGVNKAGDVVISVYDKLYVLGVGESAVFEKEEKRVEGECIYDVKTNEKLTNHGFVKTP